MRLKASVDRSIIGRFDDVEKVCDENNSFNMYQETGKLSDIGKYEKCLIMEF